MSKRKTRTRDLNPKTVRYTIRMSEAENSRLKAMLAEAGCEDNASRFILARIFG